MKSWNMDENAEKDARKAACRNFFMSFQKKMLNWLEGRDGPNAGGGFIVKGGPIVKERGYVVGPPVSIKFQI
jgi:hypothetical protein